jgi:hypothetical protein
MYRAWGWDFMNSRYDLPSHGEANKKTTRVCFLSGNITLVVFLAGKPTRPQDEWVSECRFMFITYH